MKSEIVKQLVNEEINELIQKSVKLCKLKQDSKTKTSKDYYSKKLKANNELVLKYLVSSKRLSNTQDILDGSTESNISE